MYLKISFKKEVEAAVIPVAKSNGDVGMDVHSVEEVVIPAGKTKVIDTGLRLANFQFGIDNKGMSAFIKIEGRSGLASKGIFPTGGIVDNSYRGVVKVALNNFSDQDYKVSIGDRIAQFVVYPVFANGLSINNTIDVVESTEVIETERNANGFGSSGK